MSKEPVKITSPITVSKFAEQLGLRVTDVMQELMKNGVMATINDSIDFETATIVGGDLGFEVTEARNTDSEEAHKRTALAEGEGVPRPPVVAIMGHVDHGKTTLLDAIRNSNVAAGEAGGITQHVSAYQITHNSRVITFLDTPGHEAFSLLREHGATLTDVAVIVVAADDGVKPQTEEAIKFAQKAGVKIIVAVNKIDKPEADPNRIRQQLSEHNLNPEEWGGDTVVVDISAQKKQNLDKLLDMILLVSDIENLRARETGSAEGVVIESQLITGKGAVASLLIEHGELSIGDFVVAGDVYGKVRSLEDFTGAKIKTATASMPVAVSGWKAAPKLGSRFYAVTDEKTARSESVKSQKQAAGKSGISQQEGITAAIKAGKTTKLPLVVKADVDGSLSSLVQSLNLLGNEEVKPEIISSGVGNVSESDVALAESAGAVIVGFNVSLPSRIKQLAARANVEVVLYKVIYELLDEVKGRLSQLLTPETIEEVQGTLEVKGVFKTARHEIICGGLVTSGKITPELLVRHLGGDEVGTLTSVQKEQQSTKEVREGDMCGLNVSTKSKAQVAIGDKLEFFTRTQKERSL